MLSPCYFIPRMDWWQGWWGHGPVPPSHHGMLASLSSQKPWGDLKEFCVGRRGGSWSTLSQEMVPVLLGLAASAHLCLGEALLLPVNIWELLLPHFYARPRAACWEMLTGLSMTTNDREGIKTCKEVAGGRNKGWKSWVYLGLCERSHGPWIKARLSSITVHTELENRQQQGCEEASRSFACKCL